MPPEAMVDRRLQVEDARAPVHALRPLPGGHPDAPHLRLHLAMAIRAHAAARPIAQALRAVHRAGHSRIAENALAAHPAVEEQAFRAALHGGDRWLEALIADPGEQRAQTDQHALQAGVEALQAARMPYRPMAKGVHLAPRKLGEGLSRTLSAEPGKSNSRCAMI